MQDILQRDDLAAYLIAGVPKSFKKKLQKLVEQESSAGGEVMLLDDEITEWLVARVRGVKTRSHEETPGSAALWRAYRALSAARYHLQEQDIEADVRQLRSQVEELWRQVSPMMEEPEEEAVEEEEA